MDPTPQREKQSYRFKDYLFYGILILVTLAGMEGVIRILVVLIPGNPLTQVELLIPDRRLGERLNPNYPGHDQNGFRNRNPLRKADLVVLGDSQSYGHGVPLERLWPQQLGELTGMRAYNMGVPGYGPVQSLFLLDYALDLGPTVVLEAFYSGNDLYDAFRMAYYLNDLKDLKSVEQDLVSAIAEWEKRRPLSALISEVYNYRERTEDSGLFAKAKLWLNDHVMVYRLLRTARDRITSRPAEPKTPTDSRADAQRYPEDLLAAGPGVPGTIFTPRYRLAAIDLADPRIAEGLNVSLRAIERMSRRVAQKRGCFAVVMIPTKEFVYGTRGDAPESRAPSRAKFLLVLAQERAMWDRARAYFTERGIAHVEVGPALTQRIRHAEAVYPNSTDGHPNMAGHEVIARAVARSGVCGLRSQQEMSGRALPRTN